MFMATPAVRIEDRDELLDRYVRARMRLRAVGISEPNPRIRVCPRCGERVEMRAGGGGWSICPACGRYA
jgi:anaerobic ribonucleoside-triphosphate reductase